MNAEIERDKKDFLELKPGDRVWVHGIGGRDFLKTVTKVSPSQIHIGPARYWKLGFDKPRRFAGSGIGCGSSLLRVATAAECAEWDAIEKTRENDKQRQERHRDMQRALLEELSDLFHSKLVRVSDAEFGGGYQITVAPLTGPQVRELARKLDHFGLKLTK